MIGDLLIKGLWGLGGFGAAGLWDVVSRGAATRYVAKWTGSQARADFAISLATLPAIWYGSKLFKAKPQTRNLLMGGAVIRTLWTGMNAFLPTTGVFANARSIFALTPAAASAPAANERRANIDIDAGTIKDASTGAPIALRLVAGKIVDAQGRAVIDAKTGKPVTMQDYNDLTKQSKDPSGLEGFGRYVNLQPGMGRYVNLQPGLGRYVNLQPGLGAYSGNMPGYHGALHIQHDMGRYPGGYGAAPGVSTYKLYEQTVPVATRRGGYSGNMPGYHGSGRGVLRSGAKRSSHFSNLKSVL